MPWSSTVRITFVCQIMISYLQYSFTLPTFQVSVHLLLIRWKDKYYPKPTQAIVAVLQSLLFYTLMEPHHHEKGWETVWLQSCQCSHYKALWSQFQGNHHYCQSALFFSSSKTISFVSWSQYHPIQQLLTAAIIARTNFFF